MYDATVSEPNRKSRLKHSGARYIGLLAVLLLTGASASAQKVTTSFANNFDFANLKRYAWGENHLLTRQGHRNDLLIDQKIIHDVDQLLAAKGFVEDAKNPDFIISYEADALESTKDVEGFHSTPWAGPTGPQHPVSGIPQNVWYSVNGVIVFHVVDAKSNQTVWTASAKKKINDPHKAIKDLDKQVEQIVSKTFKSFPPRAKS
jgi:hypothetical protein